MEKTSKLKNVVALTRNIKFPTNEYSISIFQDLYDKYVNEYGFEMFDNDDSCGPFGCFIYTNENTPIIYLIEIFYFVNKNKDKTINEQSSQLGRHFCILDEHQLDANGNIVSSIFQQCPNISWGEVKAGLIKGSQQLDCCSNYKFIATTEFLIAYNSILNQSNN